MFSDILERDDTIELFSSKDTLFLEADEYLDVRRHSRSERVD